MESKVENVREHKRNIGYTEVTVRAHERTTGDRKKPTKTYIVLFDTKTNEVAVKPARAFIASVKEFGLDECSDADFIELDVPRGYYRAYMEVRAYSGNGMIMLRKQYDCDKTGGSGHCQWHWMGFNEREVNEIVSALKTEAVINEMKNKV